MALPSCPMGSTCKLLTDESHTKKYSHFEKTQDRNRENANQNTLATRIDQQQQNTFVRDASNSERYPSNPNRVTSSDQQQQSTLVRDVFDSSPSYSPTVPNRVSQSYTSDQQLTTFVKDASDSERYPSPPSSSHTNPTSCAQSSSPHTNPTSYAQSSSSHTNPTSYAQSSSSHTNPTSYAQSSSSHTNPTSYAQSSSSHTNPTSYAQSSSSHTNPTSYTQSSFSKTNPTSYAQPSPPPDHNQTPPSHFQNQTTYSHGPQNIPKQPLQCPYGPTCQLLQIMPEHAAQAYHPPLDTRTICPYGPSCQFMSVSADHARQMSHIVIPTENTKKKNCPYSQSECKLLISDPVDHSKEFIHLNVCPYGFDCVLKYDSQHSEKHSHPEKPKEQKPVITKLSCPNGSACKILADPNHCEKYTHDKAPQIAKPDLIAKLPPCPEGPKCLLLLNGDINHAQRFNHQVVTQVAIPSASVQQPQVLSKCPFGNICEVAKSSPDHARKFDHTGPPIPQAQGGGSHPSSPPGGSSNGGSNGSSNGSSNKPMCNNPYTCPMTGDYAHKQQYRHFCKNGRNCRNINDPVHQDRFVHV